MSAELDIEVPRNGNYFMGWTICDDTDTPIDITGWTLRMDVRTIAGGPSVIASAIFNGRDDVNGFFNVRLRGSDFAGVQGGMQRVYLAYDFVAYDIDNIVIVEAKGRVILTPGVTFV